MLNAIYSKRCWIDNRLQEATIFMDDRTITAIRLGPPAPDDRVVDCGNDVVMPGVIDAHVHINEPGRTAWEGFETATRAAAAGGTTTLVDMPLNSSPVTTSAAALQLKLEASKGKISAHCGFYGGLVPDNLEALPGLLKSGILGMKAFLVHSGIDEFPNVTEADLDAALPAIAASGLTLLLHCEWESELNPQILEANPRSYSAYLASRPKASENESIRRIIELCRKYRCPMHIVHLSSAEALDQIAAAKAEGLPLTVETCVQYLFFYAEAIPDAEPVYKCAPPIREKSNNEALKKALAAGLIDFITTDHSPAPADLKALESGDLQKAWGGIAGIQFLLPAAWTALKDTLSLEAFIPLLTANPAHFLKIFPQKGSLQVGSDADLVVWAPEQPFEVKPENILFKHPISPYISRNLYGAVRETYVHGALVFQQNTIKKQNKGTWLLRP